MSSFFSPWSPKFATTNGVTSRIENLNFDSTGILSKTSILINSMQLHTQNCFTTEKTTTKLQSKKEKP